MTGKDLLEMLNKMSEKELLNTHYDPIGFDLNEVDYYYEEMTLNGLCDGELYDEKFANLSDDDKRNLLKQMFETKDAFIYRCGYIEELGDILRDKILKRLKGE